MYLVDIGNRYAHLFDGKELYDLSYDELFLKYNSCNLYYINVNTALKKRLSKIDNWINIEPYVKLQGAYKGMGIDRKVLLNARMSGIFIDAGSAITIDIKIDNRFVGGTILPGIWRVKECYKDISPILEIDSILNIDPLKPPKSSTKMSISYGIIAPIVALVKSINRENLPIYCCGGDGKLIAKYLNAIYDEYLLFEGMKKVIKENF